VLIKVYAQPGDGERRHCPAEVVEAHSKPVLGDPDRKKICTSRVERQNLATRMQIRRMTRLTNTFSKKWENRWAALCLHFAWYNSVRIHSTLRVTPAMEARITNRVWEIEDLLA
jgi:transposase InsO family protein